MSSSVASVLVFDGFADWEPSYALAELRRSAGWRVVTVGFDDAPVTSMGGLRIVPDRALATMPDEHVALFLLPGGDLWEGSYPRAAMERVLHALRQRHVPIAAICGATLALGRAGLLDDVTHTSNAPEYVAQHAPEYRGQARYSTALAARDAGIITASGLGAVEFAREIFAELGTFSTDDLALWFDLFKHGMPTPSPAT